MPIDQADYRKLTWLALAAAVLVLLYALAPVLTPFFLAGILAYICQPLVLWLGRRRMPRTLAVILVMLLEALLIALFVLTVLPLFVKEITLLVRELPGFLDRANASLAPWIRQHAGVAISLDSASVREWVADWVRGADGLGMKLLASLHIGGLGLLGVFATAVLVPVVQFYLMRDWEPMLARIDDLIPRLWHERVTGFIAEADQALAQYLHGQILVILVMGCSYTLGLWLTGLEFFLPIGIITGVLVFVPYVGAATGFVLATLSAVMQFSDWTGLAWVWAVFIAGQAIEGNFITPKFVGERIGLHPVAVIFALLAFGQVLGFFGLLLALPASAVLLVLLRQLRQRYLGSRFYKGRP
ncbi:MAG: AI-2E family transporter [Betaproteobacteria bacterium]|nr:AI-2E family transporter [Betaproteobacteria bacterium]